MNKMCFYSISLMLIFPGLFDSIKNRINQGNRAKQQQQQQQQQQQTAAVPPRQPQQPAAFPRQQPAALPRQQPTAAPVPRQPLPIQSFLPEISSGKNNRYNNP